MKSPQFSKPVAIGLFFVFTPFAAAAIACEGQEASASKPVKPMPKYSKSGHDLTPLSRERIAEITKTLSPLAVEVTQKAATERAFTSELYEEKRAGVYVSAVGGLPLFKASAKFDSKTGWPSFFEPIDPAHIIEKVDRTHGMDRVEVLDARSGAHLGHVFDDGPAPTGKRYCINGVALKFIPEGAPVPSESMAARIETAYFAGGCFWGVEDVFEQIPGVIDAMSGYQGGRTDNPSYKDVCYKDTGHAESVKITFDSNIVSYRDLLDIFFKNHDATQLNRQGPDVGDQYRSAIFAATEQQKKLALDFIAKLQTGDEYKNSKIVTVVSMAPTFFPAEEYHQDYHKKHGGSCRVKR